MSFDVVHDDLPLAVHIDPSDGLYVGGVGGADVGLLEYALPVYIALILSFWLFRETHLDDFIESVDAVVGVGQHILVHLLHGVVVVLQGVLDLINRILLVF